MCKINHHPHVSKTMSNLTIYWMKDTACLDELFPPILKTLKCQL